MKTCINCGREVGDGVNSCANCGTVVSQNNIGGNEIEFHGKNYSIGNITVKTNSDVGGIIFNRFFYILAMFEAYIKVNEDKYEFSGNSFIGIGNRKKAEKEYIEECKSLYQKVKSELVSKQIEKIRSGGAITIKASDMEKHAGNWKVTDKGIVGYKMLKEYLIPKEEIACVELKKGVKELETAYFVIHKKDGRSEKKISTSDYILNLLIPDVAYVLYG
jgi:hypothetical protein